MAVSLGECPEVSILKSHYEETASKLHMRDLFAKDPKRFEKFRYNRRFVYLTNFLIVI